MYWRKQQMSRKTKTRFDTGHCADLKAGSTWAGNHWGGSKSMSAKFFVDTNILVYAHDRDAGKKHHDAKNLVKMFWEQPTWPAVSVQVLQELFVNLHRKGVSVIEAKATVQDYAAWKVVENTVELLEAGIDEMQRWQVSFWDSLILAAARHAGSSVVYSEDMNHGQDYGGILVENPFKD
jgi:predicted nucleic acid-binding protein